MGASVEALEKRILLSDAALTAADVNQIIQTAASVSIPQQAIAVVDRNGDVLAIYAQTPSSIQNDALGTLPTPVTAPDYAIEQAVERARTAAFFESTGNAFSTRTARFIIQDQFPFPIANTPGGPLYGVEFSSLPGSDVLPAGNASGINGYPGGLPLYIGGQPVGAIGVAGAGNEVAPRADLVPPAGTIAQLADPTGAYYNGFEEPNYDEAVALAAVDNGFAPPSDITANNIFLGGFRLPYVAEAPATAPLDIPGLQSGGSDGGPRGPQFFDPFGITTAEVMGTPAATITITPIDGNHGQEIKPLISDPTPPPTGGLTQADVTTIVTQAVAVADTLRSAIREPTGQPTEVWISVVNTTGQILGIYRMNDATMFSEDVSVQKARTAAFFSSDTLAISTRALGFISQEYFPSGITNNATGPLYHLQDVLSASDIGPVLPGGESNPLANGITIFPGGVPLYINGQLVGAVGISGDGVDQDDEIAYYAADGFQPAMNIRSDYVDSAQIAGYLKTKIDEMPSMGFNLSSDPSFPNELSTIDQLLSQGLDGVRLPYVKFGRNPNL